MTAKLKELESLSRIFWYLAFGICFAVIVYACLVNKTVHNVAERQKMESEISKLNSKLSELEFIAISVKNSISPEYAHSLGFQDVKNQQFVRGKSQFGGLSLKTIE